MATWQPRIIGNLMPASVLGVGKQLHNWDGGCGVESIALELVITCAWNRSMGNCRVSKKRTVSGRSMLKYMNKNVFTHRIWPHFYTNGILKIKKNGSPPKTFHVTVPRWLEPIWRVFCGNKMCRHMGPLKLWEFHARVFSLAGSIQKFCTGAGGFVLQ